MDTPRIKPSLSDIRACVRSDHECIRVKLRVVEGLLESVRQDDVCVTPALTNAILDLFRTLDDHLAMEERDFVPILEALDAWGRIRVERLQEEHRQQRTVMLALVGECEGNAKPVLEISDDVRWLATSLRKDMDHEEASLGALSEDGFVVDQLTG
jgi:hypothetical protein